MKKTYFYIDDVIWLMRDLTRNNYDSLFDNSYMKMLKNAHERYGLKVQINLFYRTDFYYGNDEFTLAEMTDKYKDEWESISDWVKFSFHAKQEFPDYPYLNASYDDVYSNYTDIQKEVYRFASEKNWCWIVNPHWRPMSKEGCQALVDLGVLMTCATTGEKREYTGDPSTLPYGHAGRLLQNKKPETGIFTRKTKDLAILNSLCSHNHLTEEQLESTLHTLDYLKDEATGIFIKTFLVGPLHNLSTLEGIKEEVGTYADYDFVGWATHEQYFYPEYYAYQPDYEEKLYKACEAFKENGFEFIFMEEIIK